MPDCTKDEDVIRLEERTSGLERSDRRHYVFEIVMLIAFITLCLLVVNGCKINTPSAKVEGNGRVTEKQKEWKYTSIVELEGISFLLDDDAKKVFVYVDGNLTQSVIEGEEVNLARQKKKITCEFEDESVRVYSTSLDPSHDGTPTHVGTFNYE